jgi:hypothetical protein
MSEQPFEIPSISLERMTVDEYAAAKSAAGDAVRKKGTVYWTRGRGFFYRPLVSFQPLSPRLSELPVTPFGGCQFVTADPKDANSSLGFLMLDQLAAYSLQSLEHNRRRLIKNSARQFSIRKLIDLAEFQNRGHLAYVSFYQRTRYQYQASRLNSDSFARWAKAVFACPKALILGGYDATGLQAVSISYWVEETVLYSTFFSQTSALQQGVGELMFHSLRVIGSRTPGARAIYVRPYQGGNGMDKYYLLRGAKLSVKPARLLLNPGARIFLKLVTPRRYAVLLGEELNSAAQNNEPHPVPLQGGAR